MDGAVPEQPGHSGVGAAYAHVTAPLRRLADRYATEVCLSLVNNVEIPETVRSALHELPEVMTASGHRAGSAQRGAVNLAEAVLLTGREGETFDAAVLDVHTGSGSPSAMVATDEPSVRARCHGVTQLGERVMVRLVKADPTRRVVEFAVA
jgi:exoribonuclease R